MSARLAASSSTACDLLSATNGGASVFTVTSVMPASAPESILAVTLFWYWGGCADTASYATPATTSAPSSAGSTTRASSRR